MIDHLNGRSVPEWRTVMAAYDARRMLSFEATTKRISNGLDDLLAGERLRRWSRDEIQKSAFHFTNLGSAILGSVRRAELNERFSLDHQRPSAEARQIEKNTNEMDEANEADSDAEDATRPTAFDPAPDKSFLPHMIKLAKEHGFQLHFHRIKWRPESPEDTQTPGQIAAYLADLKLYLNEQGCLLTDESTEPAITAEMYVDDAHINTSPQFQHPYMHAFWRCVKPALSPILQPRSAGLTK
jgi:DNA-binding transcriptional regulator YdaS (Cro superfamily)